MTLFNLLKAEWIQARKKLVLFLLLLTLILLAFYTALPSELIKSGTREIKINIGLSMEQRTNEINLLKNAVDDQKIIDSLTFLTVEEGLAQLEDGKLDVFLETPQNLDQIIYGYETGVIKIYTNNPLIGTIFYQLFDDTIQTFNQLQGYSLRYYNLLSEQNIRTDINKLSMEFDLELLTSLFNRGKLIEIHQGMNPYVLQLLSILLFIALSSISVFSTLIFNTQKTSGTLKKIKFYQHSWHLLFLAKFLMACFLALPFILSIYFLGVKLDQSLNLFFLISFSYLLLLILLSIGFTISLFSAKQVANTRLFLLMASLCLVWMFTGGLIFPNSIQNKIVNGLNPGWLTQIILSNSAQLTNIWSQLIPLLVVTIACYFFSRRRW